MHHAPTRRFSNAIPGSMETIVGAFKAAVARQINRTPYKPDHPIWQVNYHEHILRAYIEMNPFNWEIDSEYR